MNNARPFAHLDNANLACLLSQIERDARECRSVENRPRISADYRAILDESVLRTREIHREAARAVGFRPLA